MKGADYHIASLRCCFVREQLGGIKAEESSLFARSIAALLGLGWTEDDIIAAASKVKGALVEMAESK